SHLLLYLLSPLDCRTTLFPYTTLFRSVPARGARQGPAEAGRGHRAVPDFRLGNPARAAIAARRARLDPRPAHHPRRYRRSGGHRSEEHTSELQSRENLVCRLLLEKKKK